MLTRRQVLKATAAASVSFVLWPTIGRTATAPASLETSTLIYITPLKTNGSESKCQAEVWFVHDNGNAYVVTAKDAWRARAVSKGLTTARVWVGEHGVWSENKDYLQAPNFVANVAIVADTAEHARILQVFGAKYTREWGLWGPRFKEGLASGERVLLQYRTV